VSQSINAIISIAPFTDRSRALTKFAIATPSSS